MTRRTSIGMPKKVGEAVVVTTCASRTLAPGRGVERLLASAMVVEDVAQYQALEDVEGGL